VTAPTGHVVVFTATVLHTLVNGSWPGASVWLGMGVSPVLFTLVLGAVGGVAGGMIVKVIRRFRPEPPSGTADRS